MEIRDFNAEQLETADELFSAEIEADDWVLYHSTTSIAESSIDAEGLVCSPDHDDELIEIIKIFRAMNWAGEDHGGYPVLKGFSLRRGALPHLYFRESSTRSLVYAQHDFSGGETARAIYHCLQDLRRYATDATLRTRHYERQVSQCKQLVQKNGCPTHVIRVDLDWLNQRIGELDGVADQLSQVREKYRYGLVYAARFTHEDIPFLLDNGGSGIVSTKPVARTQLVGKARLHFGGKPLNRRLPTFGGFLDSAESELKQILRAQHQKTTHVDDHSARERVCAIDAFAGPDEALDVARKWGTQDIRDMVERGNVKFNEYW